MKQKDKESSEKRVWSASMLSAEVTALFQYKKLRWPRVWPDTCWLYWAHWNSLRWLWLSWWKWSPLRWEELMDVGMSDPGRFNTAPTAGVVSKPVGLHLPWSSCLAVTSWGLPAQCLWCGPYLGAIWERRQDGSVSLWLLPSWAQVAGSRRREGAWRASLHWASWLNLSLLRYSCSRHMCRLLSIVDWQEMHTIFRYRKIQNRW